MSPKRAPDDRDRDPDPDDVDPEDDRVSDPEAGEGDDRAQVPPAIDTLQAAAREAINATRALLDVAEAMVNDPETAERIGSVVRAATGAAARAARAAGNAAGRQGSGGDSGDDDGSDGVQHIPVD